MSKQIVSKILSFYDSDNPGTRSNLFKLLSHGALGGTGKLLILPVDQGFEHGPDRSFAPNPESFDPEYHMSLAIEASLSAYAAPLGMMEASAHKYAGQIPLILKLNSANSLRNKLAPPTQALTSGVSDALRLGCCGVGFTIYPGSDESYNMMEEISYIANEAKEKGLFVVIWSYPRGGQLSSENETALDVISYGAHMACLLGAHIIKVKPPTAKIYDKKNCQKLFQAVDIEQLQDRISHIRRSCFNGKRIVVFSGGGAKNDDELYKEIKQIANGGAFGSIIGRNTFQRPKQDALLMLSKIIEIYQAA